MKYVIRMFHRWWYRAEVLPPSSSPSTPPIRMVVNGHAFDHDPDALIRAWQFPRRQNISRGGFR